MKIKKAFTQTVWKEQIKPKNFTALDENLTADIAIIGGGITGVTAAYLLAQSGKKVVVLEAGNIGGGTTGSSTGNLYLPVDEHLFTIHKKHGIKTLNQVINARRSAMVWIENLIIQENIDCSYKKVPFHLFTTQSIEPYSPDIIDKEHKCLLDTNITCSHTIPDNFPYKDIHDILTISNQIQFDPYKYLITLSGLIDKKQCSIYENSKVISIDDKEKCIIHTDKGSVTANTAIMATHTPKGLYAVHSAMETKREVVVTATLKSPLPPDGIYWHLIGRHHYSIRPVRSNNKDYLLVLGEPFTTGENHQIKEKLQQVITYLYDHFEVDSIEHTWAAQNYKAADTLPYIGKSFLDSNIYIATGFAADGLVYGTLAAQIIHDSILNKKNTYQELFKPTRFTPGASAKRILKEGVNVVKHFLKDYLFYGQQGEVENIEPGHGKQVVINDEKLAAYRDPDGKLHLLSGICPHMGCAVHFNPLEKSWDCPCHGSRFDINGDVIEGPAYGKLTTPEKF